MMHPFTDDGDLDKMSLSQIIDNADHHFNHNDEDDIMEAPKKKVVAKKNPAATPAATPVPAKKTPAKSAPKSADKKPAASEKKAPAKAAPKGEPAKRGRAPGPRTIPAGYIGLEALAKEFKTEPGAIRRKLRSSEIAKPEGGLWVFKDGSRELAAVKKLLTPTT